MNISAATMKGASGRAMLLVPLLLVAACSEEETGVSVDFGSGNVAWSLPTTREDSSSLPFGEIDGYRVLYGPESGIYTDQVVVDSGNLSASIGNIPVGDYFAVVTTIDTDGRESMFSSEAQVSVR